VATGRVIGQCYPRLAGAPTALHVHLTPTSSSWLNMVEQFFALLTERQLRRGVHHNLAALHEAIETFIADHNASPKPFRWHESADDILASIEHFCIFNTPNRDAS
jgi:hypothetical protein